MIAEDDDLPAMRCVRVEMTMPSGERSIAHYAVPDDGRDIGDIPIRDLKPWPQMDAIVMLDGIIVRSTLGGDP
jgi:hypothetical protein